MGGSGSGRYSEQMVPRQDPLPAVTLKELQKHHVFTCEEAVPFANYTSLTDFVRPDHILAWQAQRVEDTLVIGLLIGTFKTVMAAEESTAEESTAEQSRAGNEGKPSVEAEPTVEGKPSVVKVIVDLSWSACHYGGERPWFLCPGRFDQPCQRRVSKLYLDGSWLVCRQCLGVGYQSDHPWEGSRNMHRVQKIIQSLGGSGSLGEPFPARPKHMQYCTYHMLNKRMHFLLGGLASGNSLESKWEQEELEREEPEAEEPEIRTGKKPRITKPRITKPRPTLWERLDKVGERLRSDTDAEEGVPSSLVAPP